jgi:hypothetical protein
MAKLSMASSCRSSRAPSSDAGSTALPHSPQKRDVAVAPHARQVRGAAPASPVIALAAMVWQAYYAMRDSSPWFGSSIWVGGPSE